MKRALLLTPLVIFVAGCGSSSSDSGSSSDEPASAQAAPAAGAQGGDVTVEMKNIAFAPEQTTAKVGQKVTWTNLDSVDHNVIAQEGADFKSSDFGKDKSFSFTPTKAGTIKYTCTLHPGMDGELTVR